MSEFMNQLKTIAETPRQKIGNEVLTTLSALSPEHLAIVVRHASELQPPNDAILGAVGMTAYHSASTEFTIQRREYAEVARSVFPDANPEVPPQRHWPHTA